MKTNADWDRVIYRINLLNLRKSEKKVRIRKYTHTCLFLQKKNTDKKNQKSKKLMIDSSQKVC